MHDPMFVLFGLRRIGLDVWHTEPGGHDTFAVCGHPPTAGIGRLWWSVRHARHLHFRFWPYLKVRRWVEDHCAECGRRFLWKDARHSYQSSDQVYHEQCMSLRHVRGQLDDLTGYVLCTADSTTRWRAQHRLDNLDNSSTGRLDNLDRRPEKQTGA